MTDPAQSSGPDRVRSNGADRARSSGADPAQGSGADAEPPREGAQEARLHPSLEPRGEAVAWSALGSLLGGPIVWGGVGILADRILGTGHTFLAIGIVVGAVTGLWIVYVRFGHDDEGTRS